MIRKIVDKDVPALFRIRVATRENALSLEELSRLGITENSIRHSIRGSHCGWLYAIEGEPVGFAMGDYKAAELTVIALLPEFESKGIGVQLLKKVEEWLYSKGCSEIWLSTDVDKSLRAYGFYIKHGWEDRNIENGNRYMVKELFE